MIAQALAAPQHRPRPLPLFLELLRSETAASPERMARALAGLRRYQEAPRAASPPPAPIVAVAGRAALRDYGGGGRPVVFVPSLINPPSVLDLAADRSLLRWLATRGVRPLLVDWGAPAPADAALDIGGHVETLLLPLMAAAGPDAALAGYCLGGTMALAAATLRPPSRLALIATPWHFAGFPDPARASLAGLWEKAEPIVGRLGLLPMELLQSAFWQLDPARTVGKFERLAALAADDPRLAEFVALEDWANDGPPLTAAAARALFEELFRDDVAGRGGWRVGGRAIDPAALAMPVLDIVSASDRIVPQASAAGIGERMLLELGHVGMIVGSRARASLWEPLARWLAAPGAGW